MSDPATSPPQRQDLFPDPRRIVTGHKPDGTAVFLSDNQIHCPLTPLGANMVELWQSPLPADNNDERDPVEVPMSTLSRPDGVVLRVVDVPPRVSKELKFMHRTISTDLIILISGTITCVLDNDEEVLMKTPGDVLVQRGTIHGWYNDSDMPCRFYAVLIGAHKVKVEGKELEGIPEGV